MKVMVFVLAMLFCPPYVAEAETVFDDTQSFEIAKAVRLGRKAENSNSTLKNSGISGTVQSQEIKASRKKALAEKAAKGDKGGDDIADDDEKNAISCPMAYFLSTNNKCLGICDGTTCEEPYTTHLVGDRCYCY